MPLNEFRKPSPRNRKNPEDRKPNQDYPRRGDIEADGGELAREVLVAGDEAAVHGFAAGAELRGFVGVAGEGNHATRRIRRRRR